MNKFIIATICCVVSTYSFAGINFNTPKGYSYGTNLLEDGRTIYVLDATKSTANKDILVFMTSGATKPDDENVWVTTCMHILNKGLQDFQCSVENKGIYVNITQDMELVLFNRSDVNQGIKLYKINYKIDKSNITTIPTQMLYSFKADSFLKSMTNAEKISFSWEKNGKYKSQNVDLAGFGRSLSFAREVVKLNQ